MSTGTLTLLCLGVLTLAVAPARAQDPRRPNPGTIQRSGTSYLGIGAVEITPERARALNLNQDRGVEVDHVEEESPAAKAGMKQGDVVLEYNGEMVEGTEQFIRMVRETPAGRQVKVVVWRGGANQTLTVTVGARKNMVIETPNGPVNVPIPPLPPIEIPRLEMSWQTPLLGIEGESLGSHGQLADFFGVNDGVLVKSVIKNSAADKAGVKAGDVIVKVDDSKVATTREINSVLRSNRTKNTFTLIVVRNKKEMPVTITLPDRSGRRRWSLTRAFPA